MTQFAYSLMRKENVHVMCYPSMYLQNISVKTAEILKGYLRSTSMELHQHAEHCFQYDLFSMSVSLHLIAKLGPLGIHTHTHTHTAEPMVCRQWYHDFVK
jgi:hypothetical protein